jgi:predicted MPP superfamily phosphohydrolase
MNHRFFRTNTTGADPHVCSQFRHPTKQTNGDAQPAFRVPHLLQGLTARNGRLQYWWDALALATGAGVGVAGYALFHEPLTVRMEHLDLYLDVDPGRLPPQGLKILHLSDTHFRGAGWRELPKINQIHQLCRGLEYDLLIHTGDFLHYDSGLDNVLALLDGLPRPRLGSYAVLGNHDYMTYSYNEIMARSWEAYQEEMQRTRQGGRPRLTFGLWAWIGLLVRFGYYFFNAPLALKRSGPNNIAKLEAALAQRDIQTLYNRAVHLSCQQSSERRGPCAPAPLDIWLAGVDDLTEGTPNLESACARVPPDAPLILLAHNPGVLLEPASQRADVILSGHTHGGQIVLPFVGAAHTQTPHLRRHHVSGHLHRGKTQIYITRGIGEGIPIRFAAPPQIALITLYPKT